MIAYLGLGSNLYSPQRQLTQALKRLRQHQCIHIKKVSPMYHSVAQGNSAYPDYYNLAVKISTRLTAHQLLKQCQQIEQQFKRIRKKRWAPRTLDIDILLYGEQSIKTQELHVPHKELSHRDFVIIPLLAIEPDLKLPNGEYLSDIQFQHSHLIEKNTISQHYFDKHNASREKVEGMDDYFSLSVAG